MEVAATSPIGLMGSPTSLFTGIASRDDTPLDFFTETATNSTFSSALSFDIFSSTLKMVTSLAIVIGLVMALSWFLQQRSGLNRSIFGRTLGILPLDNRRFLYLVDIMGRVLVLGVTEHSINLLCELTDKASIDALRVQSKAPAGEGLERIFSFLRQGRSINPDDQVDSSPDDQAASFSARAMNAKQHVQQIEKLFLKRQQAEQQSDPQAVPSQSNAEASPVPSGVEGSTIPRSPSPPTFSRPSERHPGDTPRVEKPSPSSSNPRNQL